MSAVQKMVFPGVVIGILAMVSLTGWLTQTDRVAAATEEVTADYADFANLEEISGVEGEVDTADVSSCSIENYPENVWRWCDLIEQAAAEHGLDPRLVAALIYQESKGDPQAYSPSGAVGLMQVMPRDGIAAGFQCINGPCFVSRPSIAELSDPAFNVQYGTRMLAGLVNKYGSVRDGLYAYGPANVGYYYADTVLEIYEQYNE